MKHLSAIFLVLAFPVLAMAQTAPYEILNEEGDSLLTLGDYDGAMKKYRTAQTAAHKAGDLVAESTTLTNQGVAYRMTERPDSALACYKRALKLVENTDEKSELSHVLCSIAILYANTGRHQEGEDYAHQASKAAHESGDMDMIMYCDYTLGSILTLQGKYEEAITALRGMVAEAGRQQRPVFMLKGYTAIIDYFMKSGQNDSIETYIAIADTIFPRVPIAAPEALGYLEEKYNVQRLMGQYANSLSTQHQLLELRKKGMVTPIDRLYNIMARNYEDLHQYEQAAQYYEMALAAKDSMAESSINEQLSEFSVLFDTQRKELEIVRLSASHSRMLLWFSLSVGLILMLILVVLIMRRNARLRNVRRYIDGMEEERERLARELHDGIAGDLLGLKLQVDGMTANDVKSVLDAVHGDVRRVSHELMPPNFDKVSLQECMADYLRSMPVASFECAEDVDIGTEKAFHLYRILQETVTNIRKHAMATYIKVSLSNNSLIVENDGCKETASSGIGGDTIRQRAKAIGAEVSMTVNGDIHTERIIF